MKIKLLSMNICAPGIFILPIATLVIGKSGKNKGLALKNIAKTGGVVMRIAKEDNNNMVLEAYLCLSGM